MEEIKRIKVHFKYVVIILILVITIILSAIYFTRDSAWLFLAFAGTAISIVLSVIAILITLIDVAGQRQQVADIAESAKILKATADEQKAQYNNIDEIVRTTIDNIMSEKMELLSDEFKNIMNNVIDGSTLENDKKDELKIDLDTAINERIVEGRPRFKGVNLSNSKDLVKTFRIKREISHRETAELTDKMKETGYRILYLNYGGIHYLQLLRSTSQPLDRKRDKQYMNILISFLSNKNLLEE